MMAIEAENLHFCSHLVSVQLPALEPGQREIVGNIEEIATTGACLNLEEPLSAGLPLRLLCSDRGRTIELPGKVVDCLHDPCTGYYVHVEFDPGTIWSPEVFTPKHLIRSSALHSDHSEESSRSASCCDRGVCPKEVLSRLLEPEFPLTDRVRVVAQEVASLCGEMTESEAAACFGSLFGAGRECSLYTRFLEAYDKARQQGASASRAGPSRTDRGPRPNCRRYPWGFG